MDLPRDNLSVDYLEPGWESMMVVRKVHLRESMKADWMGDRKAATSALKMAAETVYELAASKVY